MQLDYIDKYCLDLTAPIAIFLEWIDEGEFELVSSHLFRQQVQVPIT